MRGRQKLEAARVDAFLGEGFAHKLIAHTCGVDLEYVKHRARLIRQRRGRETESDSSCPRFALDDEFQALVHARGGMPRLHPDGLPILVGADGRPWREVRS